MSEERVGTEVNMDEYMKVVDYDPNGDRVVENALNATNCNFAQKASDASNLGSRSAADYATKNDLKGFQDTISTTQTTANNAQASATMAQGTATEAKCMAAEAQTTASEVKVALAGKVDTDDGKGLSTEDYTTQEKAKLAGIEAGANNYVHPETHPVSMIDGLPEVVQGKGLSTTAVMSQNAVTTALNGKVASVNGQGPDASGNAQITTVENATKLGNQPPAYYATKTAVDAAQTAASNAQATANGAAKAAATADSKATAADSKATAVQAAASNAQATANAAMPIKGGSFTGTIKAYQYGFLNMTNTNTGQIESNSDRIYLMTAGGEQNGIYCTSFNGKGFVDLRCGILNAMDSIRSRSAGDWLWLRGSQITCAKYNKNDLIPLAATNVQGSSERYKENIREMTDEEAARILEFVSVAFDWKEGSGHSGPSYSFIAERLADIDERFIYRNSEGEVEGILANPIMAAQNHVIKKHEKKIETLNSTVADLTARLEALEAGRK